MQGEMTSLCVTKKKTETIGCQSKTKNKAVPQKKNGTHLALTCTTSCTWRRRHVLSIITHVNTRQKFFSTVGEWSHVITEVVPFPSEWSPACSFAQRDVLVGRHGLWCPGVREVHPHLMMTALIRGLDPEDFALQSKSSVQSYSPVHGYILLLHGCSNRKHDVLGNSTLLGKLFFLSATTSW